MQAEGLEEEGQEPEEQARWEVRERGPSTYLALPDMT